MATQPTQDAVPSESPRDLKFNAGKIDEFVTSMGWTYTDRFGQKHYTIEGINYLYQQAMAAYGYVILTGKTFTTGATINNPNEVLLNTADGEYYKWTGSFASAPKVVPASSTPAGTGGIGPGAWIGVGDASLRTALAALSGAGIVGFDPSQTYAANTVGNALASLLAQRPTAVKSLATALKKITDGNAITIAWYGDSLTYGVDTSATGTNPPVNGATETRSAKPPTDALQTALGSAGISATVINRGYPGDTSVLGFTRWASAGSSDVSIIMYGTNDALRGSALVPIDTYRSQMCQWIEREISKGAAVILVAPPKVSGVADNKKVSPYRAQVKYLAGLYGIPYIDAAEQLSMISSMWTDGTHLTTFAYFELGWHIAALFSSREEKARSIAGGAFFLPQDNIMSTTNAALRTETLAVGGYLYQLTANATQDIPFGAYFEEDVIPVIHSYNASTNTVTLRANYGGAPDSTNLAGVPSVELSHTPADGIRQRLYLPRVNKGFRLFNIWNASATQTGFIEAIEFIPVKDCLATNNGLLMKLNNLSGTHKPSRYYGSFPYWWAVEQSLKLLKTSSFVARVTLSDTDHCGVAIVNGMQNSAATFNGNSICAFRNAAALVIREYVNGVATDTSTGSVFPATGDWTGEIEMAIAGTALTVYIDGALKATKTGLTNVQGYPALMAKPTQRLMCHSAWITGYSKAYFN
ncbi:TPA: hypothetical protein QCI26_004540 [Enterobacter soli]|nr:hypothetical protein [Enterobacter soli]